MEFFTDLLKKAKKAKRSGRMENVVTQLEAARILGVQPSTVGNYRDRGMLRDLSGGIGRQRWYDIDEVKNITRPKRGGARPRKKQQP